MTSAVAADKKLDTAAMVLRMLYIKDLRKLQTQIDEMIVQVQVSMMGYTSHSSDIQAGISFTHDLQETGSHPIRCHKCAEPKCWLFNGLQSRLKLLLICRSTQPIPE